MEVVSTKTIASELLVQVAGNPGLTKIYNQLLTNAKDSSEIHSIKIGKNLIGKSFADFCTICASLREKKEYIIPLAISRGDQIYVNPVKSKDSVLKEGDRIFAICDDIKGTNFLNRM